EAFWNSISHVPLLSVGMNCALGPKEMRPLIEELAAIAPIFTSAHPNAGLPDPLLPTGFPETPHSLAPQLREWVANGWLNIVGGCCGTTPDHIRAIAEAVRDCPPRTLVIPSEVEEPGGENLSAPTRGPSTPLRFAQDDRHVLQLSGLEPLNITPEMGFVVVGERTNITGSPKFSKLILDGDFDGALGIARHQVAGGANILDVNMDEGMIDSEATMTRFVQL